VDAAEPAISGTTDASGPGVIIGAVTPPPLPDGIDPFDLLDTEQERLDRFFSSLDDAGWQTPTACAGWRRREMVAHMAGGELYNRICLDGDLAPLFAEASVAGATDVDSFNAWQVRIRQGQSGEAVLDEWRRAAADVRRRLRERGRDGVLITMVGPYPVGPQAFHLAFEAGIHGDDMDVPVAAVDRSGRHAWMARFCAWNLEEEGRPVALTRDAGRTHARHTDDGAEATLDDGTLIAHFAGRRHDPSLRPSLARALRLYGESPEA